MEIRVRVRNIAQSSAVKIKAISGRETDVSKSGKMAAEPKPETDFDPCSPTGRPAVFGELVRERQT